MICWQGASAGAGGFSAHNVLANAGYGYYCFDEKIIEAIERGNIPFAQRDDLFAMLHFWKKEASQRKVEAAFPPHMAQMLYHDEINPLPFNYKPMVGQPIYRMAGVFVDYQKLLSLGVPGLRQEVATRRDQAQISGGDAALFEGMLIALDVLADSCQHYRRQALELANQTAYPQRQEQLLKLAHALDIFNPPAFTKPCSFPGSTP